MNKKKIAVICNYRLLPDRVGGMDYFFWAFDAKCKAEGFDVDWFFPNYAVHGEYGKLHILSDESAILEHVFIAHLSGNESHYTHIFTHFLELCTPFFRQIKKYSTAVVIAVDHNPRPLGGYGWIKSIKKRIKGLLFSRCIDLFVGVSHYSVRELIKDFGGQIKSKCVVIFNGIPTDEILPKKIFDFSTAPKFLTSSHLRYSKGIQDLIEAVALLPNPIKLQMKIDIYGEGPYQPTLMQLTEERNVAHCFNFKGSVPDLKKVYREYDYLLHPSHEETFCFAVIEALTAKVVPITTVEGGNVLQLIENKKNGLLFHAKQIGELSALLEQVWEGKNRFDIDNMGVQENFTINHMVANYVRLLV